VPNGGGYGSGRMTVKDTGIVSFYVTMPDGTKQLGSSVLEQDDQGLNFPIYVAFIRGRGSLSGRVYLPSQADQPATGQIAWFQLPQTGGMQLAIIGSAYVAP